MEEQKIKTHYLQGQNEKAVTREHFMIEKCSLCAWPFGWSGMKGCCMRVDGAVFDKVLGRAQAGTTWLRSRNETKQNPKIWSLGAAGNVPSSRVQTTGKRVGKKKKSVRVVF